MSNKIWFAIPVASYGLVLIALVLPDPIMRPLMAIGGGGIFVGAVGLIVQTLIRGR